MNNKFLLFLIALFLFAVVSCDRVPLDSEEDEMIRLNAWISVNKITVAPTASGLYYIEEREGNGLSPSDSDIVVYSYVVRDLDGFIHLNNYKDTAVLYDVYGLYSPFTRFTPDVFQFIRNNEFQKGLMEGLSLMKENGKARLIMPSSLAYEGYGAGQILPYTSLIYDVELNRVFKGDIIEYEQALINEYIAQFPTFTPIADSIYYKHESGAPTTGKPAKGDTVYVNYTGRFLDVEGVLAEHGFIFDTNIKSIAIDSNIYVSSRAYKPLKFVIGDKQVVPGYDLAVRQMEMGQIAKFVLHSKSAYGTKGKSDGGTIIQPNTPLFFNLELVKHVKKAK